MAHLYAMFLLAQLRETRAYPLILRFAALPGHLLDSLCGDFLSEDFGRVLASVCGGDSAGFQQLIESEDACDRARVAGISRLVTLVATKQRAGTKSLNTSRVCPAASQRGNGRMSGTF